LKYQENSQLRRFDMILHSRIHEDKPSSSCQHQDIINLECATCGMEFNEPALAEVLEMWIEMTPGRKSVVSS